MARLAAFTFLLAAAASAVAAQTPANLPQFSGFTYSGSGCPVSSNSVQHSGGDYTAEKWTISGFSSNGTSNCEIHLSAGGATAGWQVALQNVRINGKTTLSSGAVLDYYTQIFWSADASDTISAKGSINGPESSEWFQASLTISQSSLLWSSCIGSDGNPGILNVDVRGAIDGSGDGEFEIDSEEWDFVWRQC